MKALENNVGKIVYVLGYMSNVMEIGKSVLKVFTSAEDVKAYFALEPSANIKDISLMHGTLTKAFAIPESIDSCIDVFLIVPEATTERDSFVLKCKDLEDLQTSVTTVTSEGKEIFPYDDDEDGEIVIDPEKDFEEDFDATLFLDTDPKDIDDLYVLYGYEIELLYTFDDLLQDDSLIEESVSIYKELEHAKNA